MRPSSSSPARPAPDPHARPQDPHTVVALEAFQTNELVIVERIAPDTFGVFRLIAAEQP